MSKDAELVNYATRLPKPQAERVEEYRDRYGLNKSEAVRRLVQDGLDESQSKPTFFADVFAYMSAIALAAAFALLISMLFVGAAGFAGFVLGPSPWQMLAALSVTVTVAGLGTFFRLFGVDDWLDGALGAAEQTVVEALR